MTGILLLCLLGYFSDPAVPTTLVFPPFGHCMGIYRAGTEQLALLLGGLVRFDDPQGLACVKLEDWDDPGNSGDDDELAVYGVNSGSGHIIYNADMYTLGLYGGSGSDEDQLLSPHGIAADPTGLILVADTGNRRVVVLQRSGRRLIPQGTLSGSFSEPWDVAIDGGGRIYVTDRLGGMLYLFSSVEDTLPRSIRLDSPSGLDAVGEESWFHNNDSFICVITGYGNELNCIVDGEITGTVDLVDCGGSVFNYPVIDFWGNVWVSDSISSSIHKFTGDLEYLCSLGSEGHSDKELYQPTGLAVWRRFGQMFIAEVEGARYFWIGTDLLDLEIEPTGRGLTLDGILTEKSILNGIITGPDGSAVRRFAEGRYPAGPLHIEWDGNTARGVPVPGGICQLELVIMPTYSSKGYFSKTFEEEFILDPLPDEPQGGGTNS